MNNTNNNQVSPDQEQTVPENKRFKRLIFLVVIPLLILVGIGGFYLHGGRYAETDNAYIKAHNVTISSQVSGTIEQVLIEDYQYVEKGDVLFRLDPAPFKVAVAKAQANLNQVKSQLASSKANYSEKLAEISLAQTKKHFAQKNQKRQTDLVAKKFVSAASLDIADEANDIADQQIIVLEYDLTRIAESLGADIKDPIENFPAYQAALAELEQAQLSLSYTEVRAPKNGTVSNVPNIGQYLSTGNAALSLIASDSLWVEANFTETDLTYVLPGQQVTIQVDMYPDTTWYGHVQSMSPATGSEFALLPAQNATGNWVKVVQRVPVRIAVDSEDKQKQLRVGLSTEVSIDTTHKRQLLGFSL